MRSSRLRNVGQTRVLRAPLAPTVAILLAACGSTSPVDGNRTSAVPPTGDSTTTTTDSTPAEQSAAPLKHLVIVDLAVDWRPEGALDDDERAEQRRRLQAAEDAILRALGEHGRVRRQLHASGQVALAVDDKGLSILGDLDPVATVHEDTPDPPA